MSAECCDHDDNHADKESKAVIKFWQVRELQLAGLAAVLWVVAFVLERTGSAEYISISLALLATESLAGHSYQLVSKSCEN